MAGRPIFHHLYIGEDCYEIIPKSEGFTWLYEAPGFRKVVTPVISTPGGLRT